MAKDPPAADEQPKALAIVREDFTSDDGTAFRKGERVTDPATFRALRKGAHAEFVLPLSPAKG
ncbi:hypothetical protein [Roseomonas chloroacetimidivorans]|uniref:hypothetical protein n=1 Tax=Roseomonas chloroacetimidivorans TaxID=1766656 RepID=UPI003C780F6F